MYSIQSVECREITGCSPLAKILLRPGLPRLRIPRVRLSRRSAGKHCRPLGGRKRNAKLLRCVCWLCQHRLWNNRLVQVSPGGKQSGALMVRLQSCQMTVTRSLEGFLLRAFSLFLRGSLALFWSAKSESESIPGDIRFLSEIFPFVPTILARTSRSIFVQFAGSGWHCLNLGSSTNLFDHEKRVSLPWRKGQTSSSRFWQLEGPE